MSTATEMKTQYKMIANHHESDPDKSPDLIDLDLDRQTASCMAHAILARLASFPTQTRVDVHLNGKLEWVDSHEAMDKYTPNEAR